MRLFGYELTLPKLTFTATRRMARLGTIAAVLTGVGLAFQIGGRDGYTVPLSILLGTPTNGIVFGLIQFFFGLPRDVITSAGPAAEWDFYHVVFCVSIALNWTFLGLLADIFGERPPSRIDSGEGEPNLEQLAAPELDTLAREFEELERRVREARPDVDCARERRAA
jgi:hypothetical protein